MSNSIWKTPDQKPERNEDILVEYTSTNGQPYYIVDSYLNKLLRPKRWAYLEDIIAQADKAERLQKIAERQNEILQDNFATLGYYIGKEVMDMSDEIKQLIKEE